MPSNLGAAFEPVKGAGRRIAPHNCYSRLGDLHSLHLCAVLPNVRSMEIDIDDVPWKGPLVARPPMVRDGHFWLTDAPGWGADIDERVLREHPWRRLGEEGARPFYGIRDRPYAPDGQVLEIGARTRTIPPALRRALHHRDRGCRFPGCGLPFGQGHHIRHWAHGGPTTLSNLALLCRRHHRAVHEEGYQVDRHPDGMLRFRRPDGQLLPEVPQLPEVPADPVTATPGWLGERLDVGWAIDVMHPLAG